MRGVDLSIQPGEIVSIVGPSGSGKSTLLNLIMGIDRPTDGEVMVDGQRIDLLSEEQLAAWRGRRVGIVFQFFQLLPTLTALENAVLPMDSVRFGRGRERIDRAAPNLELARPGRQAPSSAERAVAWRAATRGYGTRARLRFRADGRDEPTGNLDAATAGRMFELLALLNGTGMTVDYVTHDPGLASRARRCIAIRDGLIESESPFRPRSCSPDP